MVTGLARSAAWAAMLMLAAAPAAPQSGSRPERPSRALFGSGVGDVSQLLTVAGSLGGGFDSSVASDVRGRRGIGLTDLDSSGDGIVTGGRVALGYSLDINRVSIAATAETAPRYYPSLHDEIFRRDHAAVRVSTRLPLAIVASAGAAYVPFSVLSFTRSESVAGDFEAPDNDFPVSLHHYFTWNAGVGTSHRLSRRAWVDVDASYSDRRVGLEGREFTRLGGGGRLRYQVGEHVFLRAGYRYAEAEYSGRGSYGRHVIDVGADLSRDFSIARRTTFGFSTGSSMITYPEVDAGQPDVRGARNRFRFSGNAELRHEMGRTWTAVVGYQRGVQFLEAWPEPLLSDSASGSLDGSISRRLQFSASVRASTGRSARRLENDGFNYYRAGASLMYALSRHVSAGVQYSTYHHRFGEGLVLPPGFGPWFDRHRVIAQVSVWAPLFYRTRRANATR